MKLIRIAALAAALMLAGGSGWQAVRAQAAPNADTLQAARDLVALVSKGTTQELATRVTAQVWPRIEHSLQAKQPITPDQLVELRHEFERIQVEFLTKVMGDAPALYARYFTAAELRELLAFYHTPVGSKALRVMPQVTADSLRLVMARMPQLQADAMAAFTKVLKQHGFNI